MPRTKAGATTRRLDAVSDTPDFRDLLFTPTLVYVPVARPLADYRKAGVPILDQGQEGACTGYGLATVVHYLVRSRRPRPDRTRVSPHALYDLARRYDEWPGESYEGSSARGAMKGWHKHGACSDRLYGTGGDGATSQADLWKDALERPLGAYFRVNHRDLVAMHAAIAEVGILYASSSVHEGWDAVGPDGMIEPGGKVIGGHAFAIVAYDHDGLWIQNSWGSDWGLEGFCHITYDDWLANGTDTWVARLGAPVTLRTDRASATALAAGSGSATYAYADLRPHIISTGNDGRLRTEGTWGTDEKAVQHIFASDFPSITRTWRRKRLLLYAHGGLVGEQAAVQRVAGYRSNLLEAQVYPVSFIWKSDFWTTLTYILQDALRRRRPEAGIGAAAEFMLDRLDDAIEPLARGLGGKAAWDEMKENARRATTGYGGLPGGARIAAEQIAALAGLKGFELHLAGHSAGSIYLAPLIQLLTGDRGTPLFDGSVRGLGLEIESLTLWAPAITVDAFNLSCLPAIRLGRIKRFALFTLTDHAERDDDCADIYHKSLLYLVSHAFEKTPHIPIFGSHDGEPILGMERWIRESLELEHLFQESPDTAQWVLAPNAAETGSPDASRARSHGDFDDDEATVRATLARILRRGPVPAPVPAGRAAPRRGRRPRRAAAAAAARPLFHRSAASLRDERDTLNRMTPSLGR